MQVAMQERMRRDDLAARIRHTRGWWRTLETMRSEVYGKEFVQVPTLSIWPGVITPEGAIVVRYLWNAVRVEASGIGLLLVPNTVVVDAIFDVVLGCADALVRRKIIADDCMPRM